MSHITLEVYLDDQPLRAEEFASCKTLADLVAVVEKRLGTEGRVMVKLSCDGHELSDATPADLATQPASGSIRVVSAHPGDLIVEGVGDAFTVLPDLTRRAVEIAQVFRQGKQTEGLKQMGEVVGLLNWLATIMNNLHLGYRIVASGELAEEHRLSCERLLTVVNEMVSAQERRDWVALADCLEYELAECLQQVLAVLAKLQGKMQ